MQSSENSVILLVEDNEDDVFLMERALDAAEINCPVRIVNDGEEATRYLKGVGQYSNREQFPYPSIVFLDLKLPYMSGFEVLKWKQEAIDLPPAIFIVVTSSSESKDLKLAYKLGASSYLVKPPTAQQLVEIAKAFRLYWLTHNALP